MVCIFCFAAHCYPVVVYTVQAEKEDSKRYFVSKPADGAVVERKRMAVKMQHRVKNNLHMVVSLLRNSQHKIFAMLLMHQKLYQTDEINRPEKIDGTYEVLA